MGYQSLRGPLTSLNVLNCESAAQLHQLVSDVGGALGIATESPAVYQGNIEAILYSMHSPEGQGQFPRREVRPSGVSISKSDVISRVDQNRELPTLEDDYVEAELVIRQRCEREWPGDYSMRSYCVKQQREALAILKQGRPRDIPEAVFDGIRSKCAVDWPEDYNMRQYREKQQFDSYRELASESE